MARTCAGQGTAPAVYNATFQVEKGEHRDWAILLAASQQVLHLLRRAHRIAVEDDAARVKRLDHLLLRGGVVWLVELHDDHLPKFVFERHLADHLRCDLFGCGQARCGRRGGQGWRVGGVAERQAATGEERGERGHEDQHRGKGAWMWQSRESHHRKPPQGARHERGAYAIWRIGAPGMIVPESASIRKCFARRVGGRGV